MSPGDALIRIVVNLADPNRWFFMKIYTVRFIDSANFEWVVREEPSGHASIRATSPRRLRFESTKGLRYLESVPDHWERLPWRILESLCACARPCATAA